MCIVGLTEQEGPEHERTAIDPTHHLHLQHEEAGDHRDFSTILSLKPHPSFLFGGSVLCHLPRMFNSNDEEQAFFYIQGFPQRKVGRQFPEVADTIGEVLIHFAGRQNQGAAAEGFKRRL